MQTIKRYCLVLVNCLLLFITLVIVKDRFLNPKQSEFEKQAQADLENELWMLQYDSNSNFLNLKSDLTARKSHNYVDKYGAISKDKSETTPQNCTFSTCFNFSRCARDFKVHVHPSLYHRSDDVSPQLSDLYLKILTAILQSDFHTDNPEEACLFILSLDSLDRDHLSTNYVSEFQQKLESIDPNIWNGGLNHIVFNLYSGTYPDYFLDDLRFSPGMAIFAQASITVQHYRSGFDVSFPLFHNEIPLRNEVGIATRLNYPARNDPLLLVFKGKRYVYGIGSETRNSLYHISNGNDILMLTTCKHGKSWRDMQDDRCAEDNNEYERYDYNELMANATFCLVPRGRRLGSFRFLETLASGCVPVVLADDWVLPFSEVIDWSLAVVRVDEKRIFQVPDDLRSISSMEVFRMRQQGQKIFHLYFSSVEKIVQTTFEIIRERIQRWKSLPYNLWNRSPIGALNRVDSDEAFLEWSTQKLHHPSDNIPPWFTAVIMVRKYNGAKPLSKLLDNVAKATFCKQIVVVWLNESPVPSFRHSARGKADITMINAQKEGISLEEILTDQRLSETDALFSISSHIDLSTDELNFAMQVWRYFPNRLIGFLSRSHHYDSARRQYVYTSKHLNHYSIILLDAAVFHRHYALLYKEKLTPALCQAINASVSCHDILFNFVISDVSGQPPIKLTARTSLSNDLREGMFRQRFHCFQNLIALLGRVSLIKSNLQFDPVLYRDAVSISRKKYRNMDGGA